MCVNREKRDTQRQRDKMDRQIHRQMDVCRRSERGEKNTETCVCTHIGVRACVLVCSRDVRFEYCNVCERA